VITTTRNWWHGLDLRPRITIVPDPSGIDWALRLRNLTEWAFKLVGWLAILATLRVAYTKTGHVSFVVVACALETLMFTTLARFLWRRLKFEFVDHQSLPDGWKKVLHAVVTGAPLGLVWAFAHNWVITIVNDISQIQFTGCH
jgi:hypothetical protein